MAAVKLAAVAAIGAAGLALAPTIAAAATYTVDNDDGGGASGGCTAAANDCNLATAISRSNSNPGTDTIKFDPSAQGEIDLSANLPTVSDGVSIDGPGARTLAIDGQNSYRPLRLGTVNGRQVRISGLTFRRSYSAGVGGTVNVEDTPLRLKGVRIEDSESSGAGGAIYAIGSEVEINNSVLADSEGERFGGAIYLGLDSPLTLSSSEIQRSVSTEDGGAIAAIGDSPVTVERSTLADNRTTADEADGGALYADDSSDIEIKESTLAGNLVVGRDSSGGAVYSTGTSRVSVYSSTFTDNKALDDVGISAGGAIAAVGGGPLTVEGSTFSGNESALGGGGAIRTSVDLDVENSTFFDNVANDGAAVYSLAGELDAESITVTANDNVTGAVSLDGAGGAIRNSIVAGNRRGDPVNLGSDLVGDSSEALVLAHTQLGSGFNYVDAAGNIIDPDPRLAALADNGGPTETMAISTESPAYNAGSSAEESDQRGVPRPQNGSDDIGAYELDTTLEVSATAKKTQKQKGRKILVKVKVKAKEDLEAKATGKVKVNPSYKLKPVTKSVASAKSKTLKLKPKKSKDAKKIAKALKQGSKATAKLKVELADRAGNKKTTKVKVKLKR